MLETLKNSNIPIMEAALIEKLNENEYQTKLMLQLIKLI